MAYTPTVWVNDNAPDIDEVHLNKMEDGIVAAHAAAGAASATAATASAAAFAAQTAIADFTARRDNPNVVTAVQAGARHHKNAKKRGAAGNGVTDDTLILQTLLDEIRDAGGGELYLPNDGGTVYKTRGLWVPAKCRIVSDGAKVAFWDSGDPRDESPDGDLRVANGFNASFQRPIRGGASFTPSNVLIEGMTIDAAAGGYQNCTALFPSNSYYTYWQANPWAGDPNRRPSNVYPANSLAGLVPINLAGSDMTVRDVVITGTPYDAIQISGSRITLERVTAAPSRRNNISVFNGSELEFYKVVSNSCLAIIPTQRTVNSSWTFREYAPGCGIEIEPFSTVNMEGVRFRDCTMKDNGGAGIGIDLDEGGSSTLDGCVIDGCYLAGNGGPSRDDHTIMDSAVKFGGGGNSAHTVFISNSSLKSSRAGRGLDASGAGMKVILSSCDLRFNASGATLGAYVDGGGNITA